MTHRGRVAASLALSLALGAGLMALSSHAALAAGPFGVGLPEPAPTGGGFLPGLFAAIARWQSQFYQELTATLRAMKTDGRAGLWLIALSFLYGVLHAAGPGHGKAVISAYVLANRETARNGAVLAFVSALAQAVAAVVLVSIAAIALGATSIAMTQAAQVMEIGSFALITGLGVWLVWRKIVQPIARNFGERYAPIAVTTGGQAVAFASDNDHHHDHGHAHDHGHHHHHHDHSHHHHDHGGLACDCGHVHAPTPDAVAGKLDWKKASSAIAAVGFRPCTGALIVLVFALSQGIYAAGILATFAMGMGTGLTVATLTLLAVSVRAVALRAAASRPEAAWTAHLHTAFEAAAAVVILLFGALMLGASLYAV